MPHSTTSKQKRRHSPQDTGYLQAARVGPASGAAEPVALPRRRGRPTTYSREIEDQVTRRMLSGQPMKVACRAIGLPPSTFLRWVREDRNGICDRYARARELMCDLLLDEIVDIADAIVPVIYDKEGRPIQNHIGLARARLRIDAHKWYVSKLLPKVYGRGGSGRYGSEAALPQVVYQYAKDKPAEGDQTPAASPPTGGHP